MVVENKRNVVVEKRKVGVGSVWGPCRGRCTVDVVVDEN